MKKIVLMSMIAASALFAATDAQILGFYKQIVPQGVNVEISSRHKLSDHQEYEAVILKLSNGGMSQDEIIFTKGDLLLPDILDLKTGKSYKGELQEQMMITKLSALYKAEDAANIIRLGNDSKKVTKVMFSDPECPYCREELKNIEKTLQNENLKIILTPVHDKSALEKSYLIYKDLKSVKSDSDKVKVLRKYFAENFKVPENGVTDEQVAQMDNLRRKYLLAGLRSVPFFIDETILTKK